MSANAGIVFSSSVCYFGKNGSDNIRLCCVCLPVCLKESVVIVCILFQEKKKKHIHLLNLRCLWKKNHTKKTTTKKPNSCGVTVTQPSSGWKTPGANPGKSVQFVVGQISILVAY